LKDLATEVCRLRNDHVISRIDYLDPLRCVRAPPEILSTF
jgi:hypothetical protein